MQGHPPRRHPRVQPGRQLTVDPLASSDDVARQLGRDLTSAEEERVVDVLAKASALFRRISRQDFTVGESTVRLKVNGGDVRLEQAPATAVSAVVDDDGNDIDHVRVGQRLTVTRNGCPLASHEFVAVTYSHGGSVPDLVRIAIAEIAAKVLRVPAAAAAGVTNQQRSAGSFQETNAYAGWAVGNTTMLSPDDKELALSYRDKGTQVIVCQP